MSNNEEVFMRLPSQKTYTRDEMREKYGLHYYLGGMPFYKKPSAGVWHVDLSLRVEEFPGEPFGNSRFKTPEEAFAFGASYTPSKRNEKVVGLFPFDESKACQEFTVYGKPLSTEAKLYTVVRLDNGIITTKDIKVDRVHFGSEVDPGDGRFGSKSISRIIHTNTLDNGYTLGLKNLERLEREGRISFYLKDEGSVELFVDRGEYIKHVEGLVCECTDKFEKANSQLRSAQAVLVDIQTLTPAP